MRKVLICGNFGTGGPTSSGQVIKTKIVSEEIVNKLGKENCIIFNTYKRLKSLLKAYFIFIPTLFRFNHVVMFPAHSGVVLLVPAFYVAKLLYGVKLHYVVIGGWLPTFLKRYPLSKFALKRYDGIYVETNTMKTALQQQGFKNVFVMPNCKPLKILREEELCYQHTEPFKLVTFSRVMKEKGIEDLIRVIKQINETTGRTVYSLDIYGHIQEGEEVWFKEVMASVADNHSFSYKGKIPFTESTSVLASYFALVFPTRFFTEGIPGTIIDAYSAGLPVIASKWESFNDVVDDGVTGIGFEFENWEELTKILEKIAVNPEIVYGKKTACLRKAVEFIPESTVSVLSNKVGAFLNVCTFSRVVKEKGIEDAINAVLAANERIGYHAYYLTIYGNVADRGWFEALMSSVKKEGVCRYGGVIGFDKTTDALKDYYAMLFPTYYDGEGFAGTLIDALAAGIPVIASDWKYNPELVKQGFTGMLFKTHDVEELTNALVYIYENQRMWNGMRINCIIEAKRFTPEVAVSQLVETLSKS